MGFTILLTKNKIINGFNKDIQFNYKGKFYIEN